MSDLRDHNDGSMLGDSDVSFVILEKALWRDSSISCMTHGCMIVCPPLPLRTMHNIEWFKQLKAILESFNVHTLDPSAFSAILNPHQDPQSATLQ